MIAYVNIPDQNGIYSMLQLYVRERAVVVFGSTSHPSILEKFLNEQDIPYRKTKNPKTENREMPEPKGDIYTLVGAGMISIDIAKRMLDKPFGFSHAYLLFPDKTITQLMQKHPPQGWSTETP